MAVGGGQVAFKIGAAEIFAREIEGEFPSYDTILQRKYGTTVSVAVAALERAVRRAAQVTTEDTHAIRFRFEEGRLLVAADTAAGKARTPVPVEGELPASPVEICFNPDYVLDFLKEAGVESVRFSFQDGGSASMLSTGDEYRYVVMPVTLG
jgi:DNA polymerase III sliding clamp (beta) subunit (PCNA family)